MAKNKNKVDFDFNEITDTECQLLDKSIKEYSNQGKPKKYNFTKKDIEKLKTKINELIEFRYFVSSVDFPFWTGPNMSIEEQEKIKKIHAKEQYKKAIKFEKEGDYYNALTEILGAVQGDSNNLKYKKKKEELLNKQKEKLEKQKSKLLKNY